MTQKIINQNNIKMNINILYTPFDDINIKTYLEVNGIHDVELYLQPTEDCFEPWSNYIDECNFINALDLIDEAEEVYILSDCDVDGICSATIIYEALKELTNLQPIILYHTDKNHGVNDEIISQIANNALLITPDASVNNIEMAEKLKQKNVNIITLDHHDVLVKYENVITINNQYGTVLNKFLSGAGVTYKFVEWLYYTLQKPLSQYKFYDLVALSIVSDVCNLASLENRAYIYYGLHNITNPFFKFLCDKLITTNITTHELSFKIINILNAVCRSQNQELKELLFKCFISEYDNYEIVLNLCKKEKALQDEVVKYTIDNTEVINNENLVVMITEGVDGVSGLIANKLQSKYLKPAFVVHEKDNEYIGSVRSPIGIRELVENNKLFTFNQGHSAAYGTSFPKENLNSIIQYFNTLDLTDAKQYNVIGSYSKNISANLFTDFNNYEELWGQGIPQPLIHYHCSCKGDEWKELRGATIKLIKNDITFIKFFVSNQQKELWHIGDNKIYDIDLVGYCSTNTWNNKITNQVIIEDMVVTERTIW